MMMSMSKALTDKHVPEKRASRAGLRLFPSLDGPGVGRMLSCNLSRGFTTMPGDNGRSPGLLLPRSIFIRKPARQTSNSHVTTMNVTTGRCSKRLRSESVVYPV